MKYHINAAHEVRECRAKKQDCHFQEHFTNYDNAVAESEKKLQELYTNSNRGLRKNRLPIKSQNVALAQRLKDKGMKVKIGDASVFNQKLSSTQSSIDFIQDSKRNQKILNDLRNGSLSVFK